MLKLTSLLGASALLGSATALAAADASDRNWIIGPIIWGKNYSVGMPAAPDQSGEMISFDFPDRRTGHVHYVTFDPGSLEGKSEIVMRYRIDAREGTRFVPQERPDLPATLSLYFQRRGDNWKAKGDFQFYRWYAPTHSMKQIAPGRYEYRVRFDDPEWISVMGRRSADAPGKLRAALKNVQSVGFVMGSAPARGHGVYATAPARMTVTSFEIR